MKLPTSLDRRLSLAYAVMVTALALAVFIVSAAAREWAPIAATVVAWALAMGVGMWLVGRITERTMASLRIAASSAERLAGGGGGGHDEARRLRDALNRVAERHRVLTAALEAERLRSAALIAGVADGALVVDGANRIMLANAAACALLAIDQAGVASREALLRDHDLQLLTAACRSHTARRAADMQLLDGRTSVSAVAMPLEEGSGAVLLILRDLTLGRQVETTRREFVSNLSHQLRNPIAAIKAMTETLEYGGMEERVQRDFLGRIHRETDRMNALVEELLELSRLQSGQVVYAMGPVDVAALLGDVRDSVLSRAEARGIALDVQVEEGAPAMSADFEKVRQALLNLVDNALKFTPEGGSVVLRAWDGGRDVRVVVEDTGIGIEPEHLPHVFERFYKADRSQSGGGTGLGLAIAKHVVEAHGGAISVQSRPGAGTVFEVAIPAD